MPVSSAMAAIPVSLTRAAAFRRAFPSRVASVSSTSAHSVGPVEQLDVEARGGQYFSYLPGLVRVGRGQHERAQLSHGYGEPRGSRFGGGVAMTSACATRSSAMPASASASIASSSAFENGLPSAVPCTSTKPPELVMTTFMSTSAPASST